MFPYIPDLPENFADDVKRQYNHFQTEDIEFDSTTSTIDQYWTKEGDIRGSNGMPCFSELAKLAKHCLCVSHGNAVPERGFSVNKMILEEREMLKEDTIVSLRLVKESIMLRNGQVSELHVFKTTEITYFL